MEEKVKQLCNDDVKREAAEYFSSSLESIKLIGGFEAMIYDYRKGETEYVLRITHSSHRNFHQISGELNWIFYLKENGAHVYRPVFSKNGNLVESVEAEDGSTFFVTSFEKAIGENCRYDQYSDDFFKKWGSAVGRMHRLTKDYRVENPIEKRIEWHEDDIFHPWKHLGKKDGNVLEKFQKLLEFFEKLPKDKHSYGLIHTDAHPGNLIVKDGNITVIDFDDCAYKWFASDIAIAIYYGSTFYVPQEKQDETARWLTRNFMEGYKKENKLDGSWIEQLPKFLKLRDLALYSVMHKHFRPEEMNERFSKLVETIAHRTINNLPVVNVDFMKFT